MYNIFFSRIELGIKNAIKRLKEIIPEDSKVAILPWAFPNEIDGYLLENDFFKKGGSRYNRYIDSLLMLGIKKENIIICNCYLDSKEKLKEILNSSDILLLPGGNPEMFYEKVVHDTEILYDIKYFKGIILGESAGAVLQLKKYFITAKNNYYKHFAFYPGFGVLNDPFYIDVHSSNNKKYVEKLKNISDKAEKCVYAISDNGVLIYNNVNKKVELYGNVNKY